MTHLKKINIKIRSDLKRYIDTLKIYKGEPYDEVIERILESYMEHLYKRKYTKSLETQQKKGLADLKTGKLFNTEEMLGMLGLVLNYKNKRRVYWTNTSINALKKLDSATVELIIEKASRCIPLPDPLPEAWSALDILNFVVLIAPQTKEEAGKNGKTQVITIGRRPDFYSPFGPV